MDDVSDRKWYSHWMLSGLALVLEKSDITQQWPREPFAT